MIDIYKLTYYRYNDHIEETIEDYKYFAEYAREKRKVYKILVNL